MGAARTARRTRRLLALMGLALCTGFLALGIWQLQRRAWKLDLMARVQQRVHAAPAALPPEARWPAITRQTHEYRAVQARGTWLPAHTVRVQALSELGAGFWVLTPLQLEGDALLLVNRGFVPQQAAARPPPGGVQQIQGLLRISEPGGGFLRRNDAQAGRWFSRDVAAIAQSQGLARVAPFFVDAGLPGQPLDAHTWPRPGLTVIHFRNTHMVYALTWFTLAAMALAATWWLLKHEQNS